MLIEPISVPPLNASPVSDRMPGQPARRQDARSLGRSTQRPPAHHSNGPAGTEHLRTELSLELHETPDHGAVRADVLLDFGSRLGDGCQLDAEQHVRADGTMVWSLM